MGHPCLHALLNIGLRHRSSLPALPQATQPIAKTPHVGLWQPPQAWAAQHHAQKLGWNGSRLDPCLGRMQQQPAAMAINVEPFPPRGQHVRVIMKECKVVGVPHISRRTQYFPDEMIEAVEVHIREELARQVADRQAARAFMRSEKVVAREVDVHRLLRVRTIDDPVQQFERLRADEPTPKVELQDAMVDCRKVEKDVAAQYVAVAITVAFIAIDGTVRSETGTVRLGVGDEPALEDRRDHRAQRMLHHTVAKRCGRHQPRFGIAHVDHRVGPGRPATVVNACK